MCQSDEGVCSCSGEAVTQTAGKHVSLCEVSSGKHSASGWTRTKEVVQRGPVVNEGIPVPLNYLYMISSYTSYNLQMCYLNTYLIYSLCVQNCRVMLVWNLNVIFHAQINLVQVSTYKYTSALDPVLVCSILPWHVLTAQNAECISTKPLHDCGITYVSHYLPWPAEGQV